jgi:ABC-type bacteriocin/lantibiotic exporter with double-glycine peptidase domain
MKLIDYYQQEKRTVTNSLLKHLTHRTAFIITHDLNILKAVDRVILLEVLFIIFW